MAAAAAHPRGRVHSNVRKPVDSSPRARAYVGVIVGGLSAGVFDIVYAFVLAAVRGATPLRVLHSVASGLLGASAYKGGVATGALGLALHLGILVVAAWVYFVGAKALPLARRHHLVAGSVFGVLVYLFMNFVVLPLSAVPFKITYTPLVLVQGFVSHALLVGIPISWSLRRFAFGPHPLERQP